jgi:hypothetical protein
MTLTLEELKDRLSMIEEVMLIELLGVQSPQIVEAFSDLIEENQNKLRKEIE